VVVVAIKVVVLEVVLLQWVVVQHHLEELIQSTLQLVEQEEQVLQLQLVALQQLMLAVVVEE
jgi:hypothetical protein